MTLALRRGALPALLLALGFAVLEALLASKAPFGSLFAFFVAPFASPWSLAALLNAAGPLLLAALGASLAFRAGIFNLGGEGQAALGLLAGALVLARAAQLPPPAAWLLAALAAFLLPALLALLSGLAERRLGASVLLTSFLLSQATLVIVDWALAGPLRDPSSNFLGMAALAPSLLLPRLLPGLPLTLGPVLALCLALFFAYILRGSRAGYELRLFGLSRRFARAQGLDPTLDLWPLALSGGLSGLAGRLLLHAGSGQAIQGLSGGLGWNGLSIALVAGTDPLLALPASLLFAFLDSGSRSASLLSDLSPETAALMKALILLLVTARFGRRGRA